VHSVTFDYDMVNKQLEKQARLEAEAVMLKLSNQCETYGVLHFLRQSMHCASYMYRSDEELPMYSGLKPECKLLLGHERVGSAVKYDIHDYVKTKHKDVDMLVCGSRGQYLSPVATCMYYVRYKYGEVPITMILHIRNGSTGTCVHWIRHRLSRAQL